MLSVRISDNTSERSYFTTLSTNGLPCAVGAGPRAWPQAIVEKKLISKPKSTPVVMGIVGDRRRGPTTWQGGGDTVVNRACKVRKNDQYLSWLRGVGCRPFLNASLPEAIGGNDIGKCTNGLR